MSGDAPKENQSPFVPPVSSFTGPVGELIAQRMLSPSPRPGLLAVLDHFEIIRVLGAGGMGIVLLARDSATGKEMAIKLVKSDLVTNQHAVHRFLKETGHLKRLLHSNIVPVTEISDRPEGPYFVMPYFEKGSLASRIKPGRPLDTESILDIAIQVAEGLSFAHRSGIIHRDLKPANILIGGDGRVCLADFGLARTMFNDTIVDVESRQLEGTAPYVSPAIAAGDAEDTRCDIYSFGALLYEMLTGQPPYQGRGAKEILDQILAGPPKPIASLNPAADRRLVTVAEGCMARELRDRYADMRDVLKDLRRIQHDEEPVGLRDNKKSQTATKVLVAAVCLLIIALVSSAALMFSRKHSQPPAPASVANSVNSKPTVVSNKIAPPAIVPVTPTNTLAVATMPAPKTTPTNIAIPTPATTTNPPPSITATTTAVAIVTPPVVTPPLSNSNPPVVVPPVTPPPTFKPVAPSTAVQPVVNDIVQLATHGLGEMVISNYAKEHPLISPLTIPEMDYLRTNGVSPQIINFLRQTSPAPAVVTNETPSHFFRLSHDNILLKTAYEKYKLHENREAVAYCNRALELDPENADAFCIKAVSEEALRQSAEAMTAYSDFLKLPISQTQQYAAWRTYATNRLRELRGW